MRSVNLALLPLETGEVELVTTAGAVEVSLGSGEQGLAGLSQNQSVPQQEEQSSAPRTLEPSSGKGSKIAGGPETVALQGMIEEEINLGVEDPSDDQSFFERDCFILMGPSSFAFFYKE